MTPHAVDCVFCSRPLNENDWEGQLGGADVYWCPRCGDRTVDERTPDWEFVLSLEDGTLVPLGVYSDYRSGAACANAAMRHYRDRANRWEATVLYQGLGEGDE